MDNGTSFDNNVKVLQIVEFIAGGNSYGVDISEIKEFLPLDIRPTPVPNAHHCIEGMLMPRDFIIPIINLKKSLELADTLNDNDEMLMVTSINDLNVGFHVDKIQGIHRVYSNDVKQPGKKLSTKVKGVVTGVFEKPGYAVEILDLRKIITDINPDVLG
ncbi:MAG: purine-binding chemotaxis protein CheW [Clostridiales bacterium]|nr:purine-binding chemotaxis protein CheW [Clostridiales bacterium]